MEGISYFPPQTGAATKYTAYTSTGAFTHTWDDDATGAWVVLVGAGGSGSVTAMGGSGGGGGGSGMIVGPLYVARLGATTTAGSVGAGGTGVSSVGAAVAGIAGGNSSFGDLVAYGGSGGTTAGVGGAGGTVTTLSLIHI